MARLVEVEAEESALLLAGPLRPLGGRPLVTSPPLRVHIATGAAATAGATRRAYVRIGAHPLRSARVHSIAVQAVAVDASGVTTHATSAVVVVVVAVRAVAHVTRGAQ